MQHMTLVTKCRSPLMINIKRKFCTKKKVTVLKEKVLLIYATL